jgi:hypothetical protein
MQAQVCNCLGWGGLKTEVAGTGAMGWNELGLGWLLKTVTAWGGMQKSGLSDTAYNYKPTYFQHDYEEISARRTLSNSVTPTSAYRTVNTRIPAQGWIGYGAVG